ncbi:MAG: hypothetical protein FJY86_00540 [Candidatus Diapherotrites archaeon]|uniref:50S ribosomal protein L34e n=1 Tax=Candidatus Iainarchaeum sp. TaxID=3101447 RepID=A0A8T4C6K7_9ARCH|nr:hypothetical protein [Candidatus Diapherotrites archaeon]
MPSKSERRKLRGFRRTAKATRMITKGKKHKKLRCANCNAVLHGVAHGANRSRMAKISKTQRRPTGMMSGILCNTCKRIIITEVAKVDAGIKKMSDTDISIRNYMKQIEKQVK